MSSYIRLLLVDDDDLTRDGLTAALSVHDRFIIQEANDGFAAIRYYKDQTPDIVLMDLKMASMNGIEAMTEMKKINRTVPIVILTAYGDIPTAVEAMKCGAYDFTVKPPDILLLVKTLIEAVESCRTNINNSSISSVADANASSLKAYHALTPREREIFALSARGLSSMKIADLLSISERTVESHRENLMRKMGTRKKADLVMLALRLGILR